MLRYKILLLYYYFVVVLLLFLCRILRIVERNLLLKQFGAGINIYMYAIWRANNVRR